MTSRRHQVVFQCGSMIPGFAGLFDLSPWPLTYRWEDRQDRCQARRGDAASEADRTRAPIRKNDNPSLCSSQGDFRVEADDKAWFRPDRANDGNPAAVLGVPGPIRARYHQVQLSKNGVNRT
ncbi:hypothetical protein D9M73_91320 [compost metagenome]